MEKIFNFLKTAYSWVASILTDRMGYFCGGLLLTGLLGLIRAMAPIALFIGLLYAFMIAVVKADESVHFSFIRMSFFATGLGSLAMQLLLWLYLICW